jgi:hypothetical protein
MSALSASPTQSLRWETPFGPYSGQLRFPFPATAPNVIWSQGVGGGRLDGAVVIVQDRVLVCRGKKGLTILDDSSGIKADPVEGLTPFAHGGYVFDDYLIPTGHPAAVIDIRTFAPSQGPDLAPIRPRWEQAILNGDGSTAYGVLSCYRRLGKTLARDQLPCEINLSHTGRVSEGIFWGPISTSKTESALFTKLQHYYSEDSSYHWGAFNIESNSLIWRRPALHGRVAAITEECIFYFGELKSRWPNIDQGLCVINRSSGKLIWNARLAESALTGWTGLAMTDTVVAFVHGSVDGPMLCAYRISDGYLLWKRLLPLMLWVPPIVACSTHFWQAGYCEQANTASSRAYSVADGSIDFEMPLKGKHARIVAATDSMLFVHSGAQLIALGWDAAEPVADRFGAADRESIDLSMEGPRANYKPIPRHQWQVQFRDRYPDWIPADVVVPSRSNFIAKVTELGLFKDCKNSARFSSAEPPFCPPSTWFDSESAEDDGYVTAVQGLAKSDLFPVSEVHQRNAETDDELDVVLELTLGHWRYIGTWGQEGDYLAPEFFTFLESVLADYNPDLVLAELGTDDQAHCMFVCNREAYFKALLDGVLPAPYELIDPMDDEEDDEEEPERARFRKCPSGA